MAFKYDLEYHRSNAERFVNYFQALADDQGESWYLGLYMANCWQRILAQPEPDQEEIELLLKALYVEKANQGSGWLDLFLHVKNWVDERNGPTELDNLLAQVTPENLHNEVEWSKPADKEQF